ncbi:MAG: STAS domain-containing protein [Syntrophaceae bacterium]
MELKVNVVERTPGIFVFKPVGSIDSVTSNTLEQRVYYILKGSPKGIVFDMQDTDYMSSSGVRIVFKVQKEMKQKGGMFSLTNLQPQIKKVFEIINALPSLQVFSSIEELDQYLDVMQKKEMSKSG